MSKDYSPIFWKETHPKLQHLSHVLGNTAGSDTIKAIDQAIKFIEAHKKKKPIRKKINNENS